MLYPELVVFDLDACFWDQEMFEMPQIPQPNDVVLGDLNGRGTGVVGVRSARHQIRLHAGSLRALQNHHHDPTTMTQLQHYPGMRVAFASSADTPQAEQIGRATLRLIEVVPGVTVWDLVVGRDWQGQDINQIGRQPPLSSNKARSHFPFLKQATNIRYDRMLFFDDCNWGDHCGMVASACREQDTGLGVVTVRTPHGLTEGLWELGMQLYAEQAQQQQQQQRR